MDYQYLILVLIVLILSGFSGILLGLKVLQSRLIDNEINNNECPIVNPITLLPDEEDCSSNLISNSSISFTTNANANVNKNEEDDDLVYDDLQYIWNCKDDSPMEDVHIHSHRDRKDEGQTRWSGIIGVDEGKFFKKWLKQYPGHLWSKHPVLVFGHEKSITKGSNMLHRNCRIMDVALIPDQPGLCAAVSETNSDMTSYHMLRSDVLKDSVIDPNNYRLEDIPNNNKIKGSSNGNGIGNSNSKYKRRWIYMPKHHLSSNSLHRKKLPDDAAYETARQIMIMFFNYTEKIQTFLSVLPKQNQTQASYRRTQWVGSYIDTLEDMQMYETSIRSSIHKGVNPIKFWAFTSSIEIKDALQASDISSKGDNKGIQTVYIPLLATLQEETKDKVHKKHWLRFIRVWLAYCLCDNGVRMLWQTPAAIWTDRPDRLVNKSPDVEIITAYKGRDHDKQDHLYSPFYPTFDLLVVGTEPRALNLLHEMIMHFDLAVAWDSLDAILAYRLSENNARYGTSVYVLSPYGGALDAAVLDTNAHKLQQALISSRNPSVLFLEYEMLLKLRKDTNSSNSNDNNNSNSVLSFFKKKE